MEIAAEINKRKNQCSFTNTSQIKKLLFFATQYMEFLTVGRTSLKRDGERRKNNECIRKIIREKKSGKAKINSKNKKIKKIRSSHSKTKTVSGFQILRMMFGMQAGKIADPNSSSVIEEMNICSDTENATNLQQLSVTVPPPPLQFMNISLLLKFFCFNLFCYLL